jgi:hypothetical protein
MDMRKQIVSNLWICSLFLIALAVGCDTIDRTQFRIAPAGSGAAAVAPAEREAVKDALAPFAKHYKMQDMTSQSFLPSVIVQYQQIDTTTPLKLVAWENNGAILVDLFQGAAEPGVTGTYQRARDQLIQLLRTHFGERVTLVPFRQEAEQRRRLVPEQ